MVRIETSREMRVWLRNAKDVGGPLHLRALALLDYLLNLPGRPTEETATLKRVR